MGIVWKYSDISYKKLIVLDYLKNCKLDSLTVEKLTVYDPVSASTVNCFGTVPRELLDLAKLSPHLRLSFLDSMSNCSNLKDGGIQIFLKNFFIFFSLIKFGYASV